jgi:hypothetical protein
VFVDYIFILKLYIKYDRKVIKRRRKQMTALLNLFEVKIRKPGDRITRTGKRVEGGKIISRHYFRRSKKQAEDQAKALKLGVVVGVHRVRKNDIIGDLANNKELKKLITARVNYNKREVAKDLRAENDIIVQDVSLSSIIYGGGQSPEAKEKRARRFEFNRKKAQRFNKELVEE